MCFFYDRLVKFIHKPVDKVNKTYYTSRVTQESVVLGTH